MPLQGQSAILNLLVSWLLDRVANAAAPDARQIDYVELTFLNEIWALINKRLGHYKADSFQLTDVGKRDYKAAQHWLTVLNLLYGPKEG